MIKIRFRASGSNAMSLGYCKNSIRTHVQQWCSEHSVSGYVLEEGSTTVVLEFADENLYTLFTLTWNDHGLGFLEPELIGEI